MQAGKLRHRVTIERPRAADERDVNGEPVPPWIAVGDVWAAIEPLSARESFAAQQALSVVTHRITLRYRKDWRASWRVRYIDGGKQRYFYFDGPPLSPDEKREILIGTAQERSK